MKRQALALVLLLAMAFAVVSCGPPTSTGPGQGASTESSRAVPTGDSWVMVNKDKVYLAPYDAFDPADYPKAAMTGAPSDIPYFAPASDEGIVNRVYPDYDNKTFKILINTSECLGPQWYYMFEKNGGTVGPAFAKLGYKVADIFDGGHLKTQTNLMVGYYDFAYVTTNILTEYWSGNSTQAKELWRGGNDYVVVGASYNGGVDLQAAPQITNLSQLAGKTVGIMNIGYHSAMMLNKALEKVGLATESAGGNVKIEMGAPALIMNNMGNGTYAAAFVWTKYVLDAQKTSGFRTLLKWQDMGYGTAQANVWLIARRDIVDEHPEVVQALVQANYDASKQAIEVGDYQPATDTIYTDYRMTHYGKMQKIVNPTKSLIDARANPVLLRDLIDYMTRCGYFKIPYTYDQLVDDTIYEKASQ
jgi:hypothetical protein